MDPAKIREELRAAEVEEQVARNAVAAFLPTLAAVQARYEDLAKARDTAHRKTEHLRRRLAAMRLEVA
jgi:hypothetical protein